MGDTGEPATVGEEIDPAIARFAEAIQQGYAGYPDLDQRPLSERRAIAEAVRAPWRAGGPAMRVRRDLQVPTPAGDVRVRLFDATGAQGPRAALVYVHGGGFTSFSLETHDRLMREYAARAGVIVVGVDYALSPEAKFPTALDQVAGVVEWVAAEGAALGIDPTRVAAGGDSAGANLALSAAIKRRDAGGPAQVAALLLNYGFFDADFTTASQARHGGDGALLTTEELAWFLDNYLDGTPHRDHPLALPARADLRGLPPSFHVIAQCDPLADGDRAMVEKMLAAGCDVEAKVYRGATHSFLEAVSISPLAEEALARSSAWLAATLA
jgi:acetyl esterase